jgi:outer membrane protein
MKLKQLFCLLALTTPLTANADSLSISAGGGVWNESPGGNIQKTIDPTAVDINDDFFWKEESQSYFFVTLEHFVPVIPNVKLMHSQMDHAGSGLAGFEFDGDTYSGTVSNDFSIETLDLIAYYEVLDNIVSLDIGLNIRNIKIDYAIADSNGISTTDSIDETVPMLYAMIGASPWPDLTISGELSYIAYSGSSISDFTAKIAYTTSFFVGLEAGYRIQSFEFDDVDETNANLDFDGAFVGAYLKF